LLGRTFVSASTSARGILLTPDDRGRLVVAVNMLLRLSAGAVVASVVGRACAQNW
jgi:hypothetical protein